MNVDVSLILLESERNNHFDFEKECILECPFCSLDKHNYYGYNPDIYYNAYYNYRKDLIQYEHEPIYRISYFSHLKVFDEYYKNASRYYKINKLKNAIQNR